MMISGQQEHELFFSLGKGVVLLPLTKRGIPHPFLMVPSTPISHRSKLHHDGQGRLLQPPDGQVHTHPSFVTVRFDA